MSFQSNRRDFLKSAAAAGLAVWVGESAPAEANRSPNEKVNFGCIGVTGKGESDTADAARLGRVVAICDVDDNNLDRASQRYPGARKFNDYRVMLDKMGRHVDAVTVSVPDHSHGPAAAMAMRMGKHCFCQKPLAHSVYEAHQLGEIARRMGVATQMGNQGTADNSMRHNAAQVRAGAIGAVREVHVWTNRPIWPQGIPRPEPTAAPSNLHWELWLGPAPERPYAPGYHPFAWRGFWAFGTGALGDMACHTVNLPFMALDLRNPQSVLAHTSGHNRESYPKASQIKFEFGPTAYRPAVTMFWYDGGNLPPADVTTGLKLTDSGSLIIGDKGKLYTPGDYGGGGTFLGDYTPLIAPFPESPGHFEEFIRAIKTGIPAMSNFPDYASPLTQTILLGNLAVWTDGNLVEWDHRRLRAKNAPELSAIIKPSRRPGYHV